MILHLQLFTCFDHCSSQLAVQQVDLIVFILASLSTSYVKHVVKRPHYIFQDDQTALHIASRLGKPDIVQQLLSNGACPDSTTSSGYTPLHLAAREGHRDIAAALLDQGAASTNTVTRQGITPLHLAAQEGNVDMVTLLLAHLHIHVIVISVLLFCLYSLSSPI
uniref:Uncharacterized protein n=1 Tax=Periophthalmus magnuspinnatus TaxID=409849 RepID=A0A3B4B5K3_9GOBI